MKVLGLMMFILPAVLWTAYGLQRKWVSGRFVAKLYATALLLIGWYLLAFALLKDK